MGARGRPSRSFPLFWWVDGDRRSKVVLNTPGVENANRVGVHKGRHGALAAAHLRIDVGLRRQKIPRANPPAPFFRIFASVLEPAIAATQDTGDSSQQRQTSQAQKRGLQSAVRLQIEDLNAKRNQWHSGLIARAVGRGRGGRPAHLPGGTPPRRLFRHGPKTGASFAGTATVRPNHVRRPSTRIS